MTNKLRDIAFKAFWTGLLALVGYAVAATTDLPYWWAPVVAVVAQPVVSFLRQKSGNYVPPPAEVVKPLPQVPTDA